MPALAGCLDLCFKLKSWLTCVVVALLAGCSGGGSDGESASIATTPGLVRGDGVGLPIVQNAALFNTIEYERSGALSAVNAAELYSVGGTGEGQIVAVIDTGVDPNHADLAPQLHSASTDIFERDDDYGWDHGTLVAGLVAGTRDGQGIHGLAFDAEIMAIRADRLDSCPNACSFDESALARATDYAVANGADVINFSLGSSEELEEEYSKSLADAAAAGRILVFSAGNGGDSNPNYPGMFALTDEAQGLAIVVGSVNSDDQISDFSNRAGIARDVFIVAPGEDIITTDIGGGSAIVSGTSFAAPTVAGAAAALLDAAPFLSAEEIVQILLTTAQDLGVPGVDEIYGWGKLDLAAAAAPQGDLILPLGEMIGTDGVALASTRLELSGPLAGAKPQGQLNAAAIDHYGRTYPVQINTAFTSGDSSIDLEPWLSNRDLEQQTLNLTSSDLRLTTLTHSGEPRHLLLRGSLTPNLGFELFAAQAANAKPDNILLMNNVEGFELPGEQAGFSLQGELHDNTYWRAGTVVAHDHQTGLASHSAIGLGYKNETSRQIDLALAHHFTASSDEITQGSGAFAQNGDQRSAILDLSIQQKLGTKTSLHLQNRIARIQPSQSRTLQFQDFFAHQWSLAIERHAWLADKDRATIAISQPLRAINPSMTSNLPISRSIDGRVQYLKRHHQLGSQGREIDLEFAYRREISEHTDTGINLVYRHEPGHQQDEDAEMLATATVRLRF